MIPRAVMNRVYDMYIDVRQMPDGNDLLYAYERVSGIRVPLAHICHHYVINTIDGMRHMSPTRLGDVFGRALNERIGRIYNVSEMNLKTFILT